MPLAASGGRKAISVIEIVNDDMPFLVDSVMGEIAERRLDVRLVAHPMFGVRRDGSKLVALGRTRRPAKASARASSISILRRSSMTTHAKRSSRALETVLGEVRVAVQDWRADARRASTRIIAEMKTNPPPLPVDEIAEAIQFLQWLLADNFTFLGVRNYRVDGQSCSSLILKARSASCARASCACSSAATNSWRSRRRSWRFSRSRGC